MSVMAIPVEQRKRSGPEYTISKGLMSYLIGWLIARPTGFRLRPNGVEVFMPPTPAKRGWIRQLFRLPTKKAIRAYSYMVFKPLVFKPATHHRVVGWRRSFTAKIPIYLHFGYKGIGGWIFNKIGYRFFVFFWYGSFSNPGTRPVFNNPIYLWYIAQHLVGVKTGHVPPIGPWYDDPRHFIERDVVELSFRGAFAWIAFVKPTSRRRQMIDQELIPYPLVSRILAKLKIFPSEARPGPTTWYQFLFATPGMYFAVALVATPVFGVVELLGLLDPSKFPDFYKDGLKVAAILGALVAKFFIEKIAVDFSNLMVNAAQDRFDRSGKMPRLWRLIPPNTRALYGSGMERQIAGNQAWVFWGFAVLALFFAFTYYTGGWILDNQAWLHPVNRSLFSAEGIHRWAEGTGIHWPQGLLRWFASLKELEWNLHS